MEIKTIHLDSWTMYKDKIISDQYESGLFKRGQCLYRGQSLEAWSLNTSFDRWYKGEKSKSAIIADRLLEEFKKECESEGISNDILNDNVRLLGLAQHNGLPTKLLDWSESPYVAAFFAFSGHIRAGLSLQKADVAVWVINQSSYIWKSDLGCKIIEVPTNGNERIRNQFGKFTYLRTTHASLDEWVKSTDDESAIKKYIIPASEARKAIADLDSMGINFARIYPGLNGNAKAAEVRMILS